MARERRSGRTPPTRKKTLFVVIRRREVPRTQGKRANGGERENTTKQESRMNGKRPRFHVRLSVLMRLPGFSFFTRKQGLQTGEVLRPASK
jgi:hypothetical protein